ncbi:hypothetical protein ANN_00915 [Periplaneta americana]|uniref:Mutator-like transposase domain-containing protein n=1 Tax=Periplaneta americana TaxID=6978 RepID=A0ABQ8TS62_PERAM|nr:hypothetical protein ANN_00915 [Periplaneta americana]
MIHEEKCTANYSGTSGGMEVAGVRKIFNIPRSGTKCCTQITYNEVNKMKPYGNNVNIAKLECVGHVQKRMGSRLRRLKTSLKGSNLNDSKFISGKNRLTDSAIDRLQNYYGLAIRQNVDSVENLKKAVWAVYFHTLSTNEEPSHELCPAGADSWCKFNKGKAPAYNICKFKSYKILEPILFTQIYYNVYFEEVIKYIVAEMNVISIAPLGLSSDWMRFYLSLEMILNICFTDTSWTQSRAVASWSKASCLELALRNARWFESSWGRNCLMKFRPGDTFGHIHFEKKNSLQHVRPRNRIMTPKLKMTLKFLSCRFTAIINYKLNYDSEKESHIALNQHKMLLDVSSTTAADINRGYPTTEDVCRSSRRNVW